MCYIFYCFGWALDLLQRVITFMLACVLMLVVCCGMFIAITAGVAYGYNYSMAEFLTFTRQRTTVYMRRGQFYDNPDVDLDNDAIRSRPLLKSPAPDAGYRRTNDNEDLFGQKKTLDYQDLNSRSDAHALPSAWNQLKDTQSYAQVLSKYSDLKDATEKEQIKVPEEAEDTGDTIGIPTSLTRMPVMQYPSTTMPRSENTFFQLHAFSSLESEGPPLLDQTAVLENGPTQIIMRKLSPSAHNIYLVTTTTVDNSLYDDYLSDGKRLREQGGKDNMISVPPYIKLNIANAPKMRPYKPVNQGGTTKIPYDYPDEIDEEKILFRANYTR